PGRGRRRSSGPGPTSATFASTPRGTEATELSRDELSYAGRWTIGNERAVAGLGARLRLHFHAHDVYLVQGGHGRVQSLVDGRPGRSFRVDGDRLYTIVSSTKLREGLLELRFAPGVNAYAFTFG